MQHFQRAQHPTPARTLFKWNVIDALERCPPERPCAPCELLPECASRAKRAAGHVPIDDAITLKRRVAESTWQAEMLCERPDRSDLVYPEFDRRVHAAAFRADPTDPNLDWLAAIDFGFRAPTVVLVATHAPDGTLRIVDERSEREALIEDTARFLLEGPYPVPRFVAVDPAGRQRSEQTGLSNVAALRRAGLVVKDRRATLHQGLAAVRARLRPAAASPSLFIHPRCATLIESLETYHFPPDDPAAEHPVKDGPDHAADALRYLITTLDHAHRATCQTYW